MQEYIKYCQDWGETPRTRKAVTDMFKKMGAASKRRSDGLWFYLGQRQEEPEEKREEVVFGMYSKNEDDKLPF